jgi:multiple sugar transport system substrate-binding protein
MAMKTRWMGLALMAVMVAGAAGCARKGPAEKAEKIVIAWAQWAPADYLAKLSKDYTQETGTEVVVEQIPWPDFQAKIFTAFAAQDDAYDMVVGDSQWLGRCSDLAGNHYLELTDWMNENLAVDSFSEMALMNLGEYPKGSGRYWAVPAETDAVGFAYRKDLFEDPDEMAAFRARYGYEPWASSR